MSTESPPISSPFSGVPYHDIPTMTPPSPDIRSPGLSDTERPNPPHRLTFRSSVGLIPTPGTVSRRHPTYVPHLSCLMEGREPLFIFLYLFRSRFCYSFGSYPWVVPCLRAQRLLWRLRDNSQPSITVCLGHLGFRGRVLIRFTHF